MDLCLSVSSLKNAYARGELHPIDVVQEVYRRIAARGQDHVWTELIPESAALDYVQRLDCEDRDELPLFGIPFSVKDNIHVEGMTTTAGCPEFGRIAPVTATCVQRVLQAGGILIGKNTMDQFATGLVGVRSPTGHPANPFDSRYIPGGSSSGSAVAVACGLVSVSLGSDTGGSGRVPAALSNIVGLKPSVGAVSSAGLLYCNRSFDCVPIFALTCDDAWQVFDVVKGPDPLDPYSRIEIADRAPEKSYTDEFRFATPPDSDLEFFGDASSEACFHAAVERLVRMGGQRVGIDYSPFRDATGAVFSGPMLAERLVDYGDFIEKQPEAVLPVVRQVIERARRYSATEAFSEIYRLQALRQRARQAFSGIDVMVCPTVGTVYRCDEVAADPVNLNTNNGRYTYFVNPLDLCAIALPAGMRPDGLPFGVQLIAQAGQDERLWRLGRRFHSSIGGLLGATGYSINACD